MPLLGQHSQNPNGNPAVMAALGQLETRAAAGDARARGILQTISSGGTTHGASVPGWNGDINWGATDDKGSEGGRAAERKAATDELAGNGAAFAGDSSAATSGHKDWTGGTLADIAPALIGLIPGIGLPAAMLLGAGMGGLEAGTGVTNHSVLAGAGLGAAAGGAGNVAGGFASDAAKGIGSGGNVLGSFADAGHNAMAALGSVASPVEHALTSPGMLGDKDHNLDLGKTLGLGLGVANTVGQTERQHASDMFNQSNVDARNQMLSRILAQPRPNFAPSAPSNNPTMIGG